MHSCKKQRVFFYSLMNQYFIDRNTIKHYYREINDEFVPLRPFNLLSSNAKMVLVLLKFFNAIYILFFYMYLSISFLLMTKYIFKKTENIENIENLILDYSTSAIRIIEKEINVEYKLMSTLNNSISFKLLLVSFKDSILAYKKFSKFNKKYPGLKLQFYITFKWFITYNILCNIKVNKIYFVNHYDRWATLISGVDSINTKYMFQHGQVINNYYIYKKIKPDIFYFFDKDSLNIFLKQYIIISDTENCIKQKNVFQITSNLTLKAIITYKILFIGQPQVYKSMKTTIEMLQMYDIFIFIKPHPLFNTNEFNIFSQNDNIHILSKNDYPRVDLAVYESSTLGSEYKSIGIKTIKINVNDSPNTIFNIIKDNVPYDKIK